MPVEVWDGRGEGSTRHPSNIPEAIPPNRKPRSSHLRPQQIGLNKRVGHDRSVEGCSGRTKRCQSILQHPYRCNEGPMEVLVRTCTGLTYLKKKLLPCFLRGTGCRAGRRHLEPLFPMWATRTATSPTPQRQSRRRRKKQNWASLDSGDWLNLKGCLG